MSNKKNITHAVIEYCDSIQELMEDLINYWNIDPNVLETRYLKAYIPEFIGKVNKWQYFVHGFHCELINPINETKINISFGLQGQYRQFNGLKDFLETNSKYRDIYSDFQKYNIEFEEILVHISYKYVIKTIKHSFRDLNRKIFVLI